MSVNKVLNRPMFRKVALKKGYIKPIHAQSGRMVGAPTQDIRNMRFRPPAINTQGFYGRNIRPFLQRTMGDIRGFATQPGQFFTTQPLGKTPGIGTARLLGIEGLIKPIGAVTSKLGMPEGTAKSVVDFGLATIGGLTPIGRAAGLTLGAADLLMGAQDYVSGKKLGTTSKAVFNLGDPLGLFQPIDSTKIVGRKRNPERAKIVQEQISANRQKLIDAGKENLLPENRSRLRRKQVESRMQSKDEVDVATQPQNTTKIGDSELIDTAKISENAINNQQQFDEGDLQTPPIGEEKKQQKDRFGFTKKEVKKEEADNAQDQANKDALVVESPYMAAIKEAKAMAAEMRKGRASQTQLIFLSNLASGLLTGTTNRRGLSGALEVFGKALGPAVNNMVMVKMKENELDQNLLGRALEFQSDFLKAQNDAFVMPDTEEVGVIQIQNEVGRIINVPGRILKDGTKQRATGEVDSRGTNIYVTVDPSFNFIANKDQNKETLEIAGDLAGKYGALNLINRSLAIATADDAKARVGVTGAIGLYGGRLTEALGDVFSFAKPSGDTKAELKKSGKTMFELEREKTAMLLVNGGVFETKQEAKNYLNKQVGTFEKNYKNALNNAEDRLKGGSSLDYERLAINETVLVYKLANSLKSKDRLTQKDIEMAKNLVKVFPLLRGEKNVIASLTATAETILDDIKQQERLYERAGGSSQYLLNERRAYGLSTSDTLNTMGDIQDKRLQDFKDQIKDLTEEDFLRIFPPELFELD
tara:strand:- start:6542 stop:8815 length:2274 start_codon:yes stop_codon:yes gene_type:complete